MNIKIYVADDVRKVRLLHREVINRTTSEMTVADQIGVLSENLLSEFQKGNTATAIEIKNWHPDLVGKDQETIMNTDFTDGDAKLTVSRGYGFKGWEDVSERGNVKFDMVFEHAVDTMLNGNLKSVRKQVKRQNDLLVKRSGYGHRATLLHYAASNGVEIRRQKVPMNLPEIAAMLIEAGADPIAKADLYGGEPTAYELASTSAHPKDAGIMDPLLEVLKFTQC